MKNIIEKAYAGELALDSSEFKSALAELMQSLDQGKIRVAEFNESAKAWQVNTWVKQGILLYFRTQNIWDWQAGEMSFADKIPLKQWKKDSGVRVVPPAVARFGSFIEKGAILMPSYVNIGAYVGAGTMVDTWATVGSCAQIGKNVHLSGGVGIGGVLEPLQASPVIIEDDAFIGSRCIVVEGAVVERGAVLGAGVTITASTQIIDVTGPQEKVYKARVPSNAVVIPGVRAKQFPSGTYHIATALIIGYRTEATDKKTSLNQVLRDFELSV